MAGRHTPLLGSITYGPHKVTARNNITFQIVMCGRLVLVQKFKCKVRLAVQLADL